MVKNYKVWISSEEQFVVNKLPLDKNTTFLFFLTDYGVAIYAIILFVQRSLSVCQTRKIIFSILIVWIRDLSDVSF